ncbi:MAG: carboxypeptidase regulatory-like domain-containing protein, partial [Acidobacteriia bacterium]|nr:carboxypeptidase regulatory-like domain-containing protein [Terriglobia bacterium]
GVFYTVPNGNSVLQTLGAQPFVSRVSLTGTSNTAATFQVPYTVQLTPGVWQPRTPTSQLSETLVAANYDSPMTQQFSFDVQGAVLPSTVLELAYVGTRGTRLSESRALNEALLASSSDPINGVTANTVANVPQRVPFLGFAPTGATVIETYGFSMFHSLQATLKREFSHGVQFQAAYTWSKAMTTVQGTGQTAVFVGGSGNSNDPADRAQRWSPAGFDRTHRMVLVFLWRIPAPKGGASLVRGALRNWSVSGVTSIQTGLPLTITDSRGGSIFGFASTSRAQLCPGFTYGQISTAGSVANRVNNYFNTAAFCPVPVIGNGTGYGDSGAGIVRGPDQNNLDLSLTKTIKVAERHTFEIRSEFFNALNHVQYSTPGTAFGTASFGVIGSTSVAARLVQFAAKYSF